ncbi:hypothetical protein AAZV13_12G116000 [Glycine max]
MYMLWIILGKIVNLMPNAPRTSIKYKYILQQKIQNTHLKRLHKYIPRGLLCSKYPTREAQTTQAKQRVMLAASVTEYLLQRFQLLFLICGVLLVVVYYSLMESPM